ncbi:ATP-binding cassette domain-containing protein [Candidatus Latescibacterota bacterium]
MKITISNLSKTYDDGTQALNDINLEIGEGATGLIGPNASGKTTLIRILATLEKPSSGTVTIDDLDLHKNRAAIRAMTGYLPQKFSRFSRMTTGEFLEYTARLSGLHRKKARKEAVDELLESLGLTGVRDSYANELSTAMKRHLEIAQAVIGNPRVLIVDEPTAGLSPEERLRFRKLLTERSDKIGIIIFSTHIYSDISGKCNDLVVLESGNITYHGQPESCPEISSGKK